MTRESAPRSRVNVLGIGVDATDMASTLRTLESWIAGRQQRYVCVTNVYGVMESQRDERLRTVHNSADLVLPDGMPLVWLGRLHGFQEIRRVYGPDLMLRFCERSVSYGYRHYLYGGRQGVAQLLAQRLTERYPGLRIAGTFAPPFRPLTAAEDEEIVARINAANPDVVWVGLGTPKQERWMYEHVGRVNAPVLLGVGAAFDFHTGLKPQAPSAMQTLGLEWLFRLITEPRRLWRRYLLNNPLFIARVLMQVTGLRNYALPEPETTRRSDLRADPVGR